METSLLIARILGAYILIVGIGMLLNLKNAQKIIDDFKSNAAVVYMGAIMSLFFGLLIVNFHNVWEMSWVVVITIFGWAGIVKGALLIARPQIMTKFSEGIFANKTLFAAWVTVIILLGAWLSYVGYLS